VIGVGTAINVVAVLVGAGIGTLVGARLSEGMREFSLHSGHDVSAVVSAVEAILGDTSKYLMDRAKS
jgi:uncharacterized membrane protein YqgA involved in biofilm formation